VQVETCTHILPGISRMNPFLVAQKKKKIIPETL